jgi:Fasciclin domain
MVNWLSEYCYVSVDGLTETCVYIYLFTDALIALGRDRIDELLLPENRDELLGILLFHVLPGRTETADFVSGLRTTLSTDARDIMVSLDPLEFDGVGVVTPDSIGCNGVVHSIQTVLDPLTSSAPTAAPLIQVVVDRFYISYRTTSTAVPTATQYAANQVATTEYYKIIFAEEYTNFRGLNFELDFTLSGDGTYRYLG